jgi:hypothetical protein
MIVIFISNDLNNYNLEVKFILIKIYEILKE